MKRRDYGQYCGLARALELVGERWALLIVRDLAVQPARFTDLLEGLPGIPTNVLSSRLKELETTGLVERRVAPAPGRGVVYALTPVGRGLEPAVDALGRWGTRQLGDPRPGEIVTPATLATALRAAFNPAEATGLEASWEIRVAGEPVVHAIVDDGRVQAGLGPAATEPDLAIAVASDELPSYLALMQAARCGEVELDGRKRLLGTFVRVFTPPQSDAVTIAA